MAGLANGTVIVARSIIVVVVVEVVLSATEGRGTATALPGRRLALAEEPLCFLLRLAEGRLGQCRDRSGCPSSLAPTDGGGGVTEQLVAIDLDKLPVKMVTCDRLRRGRRMVTALASQGQRPRGPRLVPRRTCEGRTTLRLGCF